ncbi:hypothetical protein RND81_12G083200 [Saponaria officinalis]|uniref:Wall-associated receptor kinase 2-like n=1 Tax=Saponaria officinalis TaxID=3572 RepID=A0AAW1H819_SAPOF
MGHQNNVLIILLITTALLTGDEAESSLVIASHCSTKCGNVTIPYPFGIEEGCNYNDEDNPGFQLLTKITCNHTFNPPKPILGENIPVSKISLEEGEIWINLDGAVTCYSEGEFIGGQSQSANLVNFTISSTKNMLVATGCDTYAWFTGIRYGEPYETGCMTTCNELDDVVDNQCNGVGCCQASIPDGVTNLTTDAYSFSNHTNTGFNPCSAAYPVAKDWFRFKKEDLTETLDFYLGKEKLPVIFNWGVGAKNCSVAQEDGSCMCKSNTRCTDLKPDQDGYRCQCKDGFTGNPYLPEGCIDIDECKGANNCEKPEYCKNTNGNYTCHCPTGYRGEGTKTNGCDSIIKTFIPVIITAGIGLGIIVLLAVGFLLYRRRRVRELEQLRESFFRQNGGTILDQKISGIDSLKIFTAKELEDTTDKYKETTIIGRGGYGVVYKGVLPNNQQVAIKRSLKVDPDQVEQFINEILVLSQINNRNVVKLLGCCLETDVPLLVYEYISNGTLHDHLHKDGTSSNFPWTVRLRIATEIAEVLAYLHTTISTPIIHRDMKSMNILLDETYTAKVADFGASKLVPGGKAQIENIVLGTLGYLDPEYMQTFELTDKSDVYSFGVLLVELLTTQKALSSQRAEVEQCLAVYFLLKMKDNRLFDIVDKRILADEGQLAQIKEVANLAKWCLRLKGEERPTMKEVAMELERIKRIGVQLSHARYNTGKSFDHLENYGDHLVGIPTDDEGNTVGQDSDLYSVPTYISPLGNGR